MKRRYLSMNEQQKKKLADDILNKRIVDYGNYRIIYNIVTGEISIYENNQCVMKKSNVKEVIAFFEKRNERKKIMYSHEQTFSKNSGHCLEHTRSID